MYTALCLAFLFLVVGSVTAQDETETSNATGEGVVGAVLERFRNTEFETNETKLCFLKRIAWVESKFGTDRRTFRTGYHGGIWQIDLKAFRDTQDVNAHPGLTEKYQRIKNTFGIDWIMVPWSECRKPLYSALAAWLYLSNNPRPIPADVEGQAEYWKLYYNTSCGAGTVEKFLEDVKEIDCTEE